MASYAANSKWKSEAQMVGAQSLVAMSQQEASTPAKRFQPTPVNTNTRRPNGDHFSYSR